jgi:hypothetical protein
MPQWDVLAILFCARDEFSPIVHAHDLTRESMIGKDYGSIEIAATPTMNIHALSWQL